MVDDTDSHNCDVIVNLSVPNTPCPTLSPLNSKFFHKGRQEAKVCSVVS